MKQAVLVIIKPDGIQKNLIGEVFTEFSRGKLEIIAAQAVKITRKLAEEHYKQLKGQSFFDGTVSYFCGKFHKTSKLVAVIYYGDDAIKKCRRIAGATNPKEASKKSIRGLYGQISKKGIFENVVHVSSDRIEAEREIKLWFSPDDITRKLYSTKTIKANAYKRKVWA